MGNNIPIPKPNKDSKLPETQTNTACKFMEKMVNFHSTNVDLGIFKLFHNQTTYMVLDDTDRRLKWSSNIRILNPKREHRTVFSVFRSRKRYGTIYTIYLR